MSSGTRSKHKGLDPARKYLGCHHLEPVLARALPYTHGKPNLKGTRLSAAEAKNKILQLGSLVNIPKERVPIREMKSKMVETQPDPASP